MSNHCDSVPRKRLGAWPGWHWLLVLATLLANFASRARGAEPANADEFAVPANPRSAPTAKTPTTKTQPDEGPGIDYRLGHIEGQGVTQDRSLTPVEAFPYLLNDDWLCFADVRFFPTNNGTFGGNAGLGLRYYSSDIDRLFGVSLWYDADDTRNVYFQQGGLSLETYGAGLDLRGNLYMPFGNDERHGSLVLVDGSTRFSGQNILYDQVRSLYTAMRGFDAEAGVPFPGAFAAQHAIRIYGGGYAFNDDHGNDLAGASARVQAHIVSGLDAQVQVTHDSYFQTRAFVGISWTFGPLHRPELGPASTRWRFGEHVTRNYTVLAPARSYLERDVVAVNPATSLAYRVAHVSSSAPAGGTGDVDSPFQTIAAGQAATPDLVFVHAGSVFNGADAQVAVGEGQRILGDSSQAAHYVSVADLGELRLPHGPSSGDRPELNGALGDAVVLASNSEFSGFSIMNPAGNGLLAADAFGLTVRDVSIVQPGGDGVQLLRLSGTNRFNNVDVSDAVGDALFVRSGSAAIAFDGSLSAGQGRSVAVLNTKGGVVNLTQTSFLGSGGQGIFLSNDAGAVKFNDVALTGTVGPGIDIQGGTGQFDFRGRTTVSHAAGPAVSIHDLAATGGVAFDDLAIDHRAGRGLEIENAAGHVDVDGNLTISNESGSTDEALAISNSAGSFSLGQVDVTDATGSPAVALQSNTGTTSFGMLNITSHDGTALFADHAGTLGINATTADNLVEVAKNGTIDAVNGTAVDISDTALSVNLRSISSSGAPVGIRLVDSTGVFAVFGNGTDGSGGTIQGAANGIFLQNVDAAGFQRMKIDSNTVGVHADNVKHFVLNSSEVTGSASFGIDATNTAVFSVSDSSFSGNGAANIRAQFDERGSYAYSITSSTLDSALPDNLVVASLAGAEGSTMNFGLQDDAFSTSQAGAAAVRLDWNGILAATVEHTQFVATGSGSTGVAIANAYTTAASTLAITNSNFRGTASDDIGFQISAAGPVQANVAKNQVKFEGTSGTGFLASFGGSSTFDFTGNTIEDTTDGATGLLFDTIAGPSNVKIQDNTMTFTPGGLLDRGIVFNNVTDTVTLFGKTDNQIDGADTNLLAPPNVTGGIHINGDVVP